MTLAEVLAELESLGTEQNRKIYRRHGYADPMFGVSFANLGSLKKRIRRDQPLAQGLWETRNRDAQQLALMAADPAAFDRPLLQRWVESATDYGAADLLAREIVLKTPHALECVPAWLDSEPVVVQRAGWATVGCLALFDPSPADEFFLDFLPRIEAGIHSAPNRVKQSMNGALIAIGSRNENLRGPATAAAGRIGKVRIDHGETNCKTPDAAAYIEKTFVRKAARAGA